MAKTIPLLNRFDLGMKQDLARSQMPQGSVWNLIDYIPRILGAPIRKRGSWTWGSPLTGAGYVSLITYAPFRAGPKLIKVNSDGNWYEVASDTTETAISGTGGVTKNPFWFFRDKAIVGTYGAAPTYWTGTGARASIAAAPQAMYGVTYKNKGVMANGKVGATDLPQRVWFSNGGDPLTWSLTDAFVDASFPVRGLASLRNMILVFGDDRTERIIGSDPAVAGVDSGDLEMGIAFNVGCLDARSIAYYGELVLFANGQGIWRTDGSVPENVTRGGGLRRYWIDLMSQWQTGWTLAGGILGDNYIISVSDHNGLFKDCLMLDLQTFSWSRLANVNAASFAQAIGTAEELYFGSREVARLGRLAPIMRPQNIAGSGVDANGVPVLPVLETPYVLTDAGFNRWRDLLMNYLLDGSAIGTTPSFDISVITASDSVSYVGIGALPGQSTFRRDILPIRYDSPGVALRIAQTAASGDTRISGIEADVYPLEQTRVR